MSRRARSPPPRRWSPFPTRRPPRPCSRRSPPRPTKRRSARRRRRGGRRLSSRRVPRNSARRSAAFAPSHCPRSRPRCRTGACRGFATSRSSSSSSPRSSGPRRRGPSCLRPLQARRLAGSQARVGAFELVAATLVGTASGVTCGLHEGIGAAYDENASGYRFAAEGFANQLPGRLTAELAEAANAGAGVIPAGGPGFGALANQGTMKFVVTEAGELLVGPHSVNGVEISHAVLSGGRPVLTAGQVDIA